MASTSTSADSTKSLPYVIMGLVAIPALVLLYYLLTFLAVNLFLGLDSSVFGRLATGGWLGYALVGLGLGAAGGMVAAQQRYRLSNGLWAGAAALVAGLSLLAVATQPRSPTESKPLAEAQLYKSTNGRVTCGACTSIAAADAYPAQNDNSYEASNLLRRDSTKAWISATAVEESDPLLPTAQLRMTIAPLAGHRLAGLRLRNGYCKNKGVYRSFSRVATCQLQLPHSAPQSWHLADVSHQEFFLPILPTRRGSTSLTFTVQASYPGANHSEVALAWLVPVFEPVAP